MAASELVTVALTLVPHSQARGYCRVNLSGCGRHIERRGAFPNASDSTDYGLRDGTEGARWVVDLSTSRALAPFDQVDGLP